MQTEPMMGRNELFDRVADRQRETDGWAGCLLACAEAGR
jgi:hypothetical protein